MRERDNLPHVWAPDAETWHLWLTENHETANAVWLCYFKKNAGEPSISWSAAVDEALCFGWIDSVIQPLDERSYKQYFTRRKPKSNWSNINRAKVERLIEEGRMMPAGLAAVERAKGNGSWSSADDIDSFVLPEDLAAALNKVPDARDFVDGLNDIRRWELVHWVDGARRSETRFDRIRRIVEASAVNQRPDGYRL